MIMIKIIVIKMITIMRIFEELSSKCNHDDLLFCCSLNHHEEGHDYDDDISHPQLHCIQPSALIFSNFTKKDTVKVSNASSDDQFVLK